MRDFIRLWMIDNCMSLWVIPDFIAQDVNFRLNSELLKTIAVFLFYLWKLD